MNKNKLIPLLLLTVAANAFALDTPTEDFIDNGDGTVTHKKTGLTWQRCSVGQTWTGSSCSGTASKMNWNNAMSVYGKTDCSQWHVPRIDELKTIAEHGTYNPAINTTVFPDMPISSGFWSSTIYASNSDEAWIMGFFSGYAVSSVRSNLVGIRLVKNGKSCSSTIFTPNSDFIDNNDGTVSHTKTGLMWQRCSVGQTWTGTTCLGSPLGMSYASAISQMNTFFAGYSDWRLPTLYELNTIVEYDNNSPAINRVLFPNTPYALFWSSSIYANNANFGWVVNFDYGDEKSDDKNNSNSVRLVRGGDSSNIPPLVAPTSIDLTTTLSQSSSRVKINENLTYTATVINNGTGTANNVFLKFYMPPRWTNYVSLPSDCSFNGTTTVCNVGSLAAGASVSRSITVSFSKFRGATSVGAFAGSDETDTNKSNNMSRMITTVTK